MDRHLFDAFVDSVIETLADRVAERLGTKTPSKAPKRALPLPEPPAAPERPVPAETTPPPAGCLDPKAASLLLNVSEKTLERMRHEGRGPKYFKVGKLVRYRREDLGV